MKTKLYSLGLFLVFCSLPVDAQTKFTALSADGFAQEFENAEISNGRSVVVVERKTITMISIAGATPANNTDGKPGQQILSDGTVLAWSEIKWDGKSRNDIDFYYVLGTGNPYTGIQAEELVNDGVSTGYYRATYSYYQPDGSAGLPLTGVYHKFTPKVDGKLKVGVWSNKNNRNTYVVDEATKLPISYEVEGYIDGQNDQTGRLRYLTTEEIKTIHSDSFTDAETGEDKSPYVIGSGRNFWGYIVVEVEAGKTYWFFQDSSQLGLNGFEFEDGTTGEPVEAAEEVNHAVPDFLMSAVTDSGEEKIYVGSISKLSFANNGGEDSGLLINMNDGSTKIFGLAAKPIVKFSDARLHVIADDVEFELELENVKAIKLVENYSKLDDIVSESFNMFDSGISLCNLPSGSAVNVYDLSGKNHVSENVPDSGEVCIDFSSLAEGIYILQTKNGNYKFIVK